MYKRLATLIIAGLFVLPALAATAQQIRDSTGGRFVVGQDGTPYLVMGNRLRGALVDGPEGAASPIMGDGIGGRTAFGPGD